MECIACGGAPINDDCSSALPLPDAAQVSGSLCCANPDDISRLLTHSLVDMVFGIL
ncbi:MAG: hypothetical protein R2809_13945 [Flavobacteriales bacterium]